METIDTSKRYLLFTCFDYYPGGVMNDLKGSFDTLNKIIDLLKSHTDYWDDFDIYDQDTRQFVLIESREQFLDKDN